MGANIWQAFKSRAFFRTLHENKNFKTTGCPSKTPRTSHKFGGYKQNTFVPIYKTLPRLIFIASLTESRITEDNTLGMLEGVSPEDLTECGCYNQWGGALVEEKARDLGETTGTR